MAHLLWTHVRACSLDELALAPEAFIFKVRYGSGLFELTHDSKVVSKIFYEGNGHGSLNRHKVSAIAGFQLETVPKLLRHSFNISSGRPIRNWLKEVIH